MESTGVYWKPAWNILKSDSVIIAEIGTDMTQFSSTSSISSWAGVSFENNESAGKKVVKS